MDRWLVWVEMVLVVGLVGVTVVVNVNVNILNVDVVDVVFHQLGCSHLRCLRRQLMEILLFQMPVNTPPLQLQMVLLLLTICIEVSVSFAAAVAVDVVVVALCSLSWLIDNYCFGFGLAVVTNFQG